MKLIFRSFICSILFFYSQKDHAQTLDTLINVGDHQIHFNITKGKGIPILFESGADDDSRAWESIIKPISEVTGTTLITYDRAGFFKSTLSAKIDTSKKEILRSYEDLETGLKKLGYDKEIMLVAHSYGGHLATLYAVKHPYLVKSVVLIDASGNFFIKKKYVDEVLRVAESQPLLKKENPAQYNIYVNANETAQLMKTYSIPTHIPVTDIVRGLFNDFDEDKTQFWLDCHQQFAASHPKSRSISANGCHHYIWGDNPGLVIQIISNMYADILTKDHIKVLERLANYSITLTNEVKKQNTLYNNSEEDINEWGYQLLKDGKLQSALEVFKFNLTLHPTSFNAYDSYGEALLKNNQREEAIIMYKKSIELNPGNENGIKVLGTLLK
jgi:tetratricopeptide (TPR) repeat protein